MLIATDLDGTLVPEGSATLSAYTADVLHRADRAGIPIVFVTGRPLRWMDDFWPHVGAHGLGILSNGAITYDVHAREPLSVAGIEPGIGLEICAALTQAVPDVGFAIECLDGIRLGPRFSRSEAVPEGSPQGPLERIWDVVAVKLLVRHPRMDHHELLERVVAAVGDRITTTWSVSGLVEISARGISKASALIGLCARLDIAPSDVVAFGDMPNDSAMLAWAGTSYAMANAHDDVIAIADRRAPACDEDGVAHVIESILAGLPPASPR